MTQEISAQNAPEQYHASRGELLKALLANSIAESTTGNEARTAFVEQMRQDCIVFDQMLRASGVAPHLAERWVSDKNRPGFFTDVGRVGVWHIRFDTSYAGNSVNDDYWNPGKGVNKAYETTYNRLAIVAGEGRLVNISWCDYGDPKANPDTADGWAFRDTQESAESMLQRFVERELFVDPETIKQLEADWAQDLATAAAKYTRQES